jgi:tetratricopeptide (TPR) repeat protein
MFRSLSFYLTLLLCLECACDRSARSNIDRGNQFFDQGKYADAELQYRKSISRNAKLAEGYYRLGLTELELQRGDAAIGNLQRAVDLEAGNDLYRVQLANLSLLFYWMDPTNKKLYDQVAQEADRLLGRNPNSFDGLRLRGDILMIDRKPDEALAVLRRADAMQPFDPNVVLPMAQILFALGKAEEAESVASQFLLRRKSFAPMYDLLLTHYFAANRPADAERLLRTEAANRPKDARVLLELAAYYGDSHREREMSQILQTILADRTDFPQGHGLVGDFYAGSGRWEDALGEYREGLRADPKYKELYEKKIVDALIGTGKRNEALAKLGEILSRFPNDTDARFRRAILLRTSTESKEMKLAIADLKAVAERQPGDEVARYNLGVAYQTKGDLPLAQTEFRKSTGLRKDYLPPRLALAEIALNARDYRHAELLTDEILALDPKNFNGRLLRASALAANRANERARSELDVLLREQPNSKEIELRLATLDGTEKKYRDAEARYRRLYKPGSADLRPLEGLLQLYLAERQPAAAEALLDEELRRAPGSRPVHLLLASTAMQEGKLDVVRQQYEWVRSQDPSSAQIHESLGALYQLQGNTPGALQSYRKASELAPNDPRILGSIAILQTNSGATKDAIATLEKELARDPGNPVAMNNLAFNLAEDGTHLDRALSLAESAVRGAPDNPAFLDTLGWVYARRGLNQSAIQVFRVLVHKYPSDPAYRYHLGVVLAQGQEPSDAKREFQAALSEHPGKELYGKIQESLAKVQ